MLRGGVLPTDRLDEVLAAVAIDVQAAGFTVLQTILSPIKGAKGNTEALWLLSQ